MSVQSIFLHATALAHPNIAFIKYWGDRDAHLRLPSNGSISMNLRDLHTITRVEVSDQFKADILMLNQHQVTGSALERVTDFLDVVRAISNLPLHARVRSENNFPSAVGIASSASAFAALALAASHAYDLQLSQPELTRLARRGSGSAARSIPGGFVELFTSLDDQGSFAETIASAQYWELIDLIAMVDVTPKTTGSTEGHSLAGTSPLQAARVDSGTSAPGNLP